MIQSVLMLVSTRHTVGGVLSSVRNYVTALRKAGIHVDVSWGPIWRRYDVIHIHYSNGWKRLMGVILARMFAKKVVFTFHSSTASKDRFPVRMAIRFSTGVIVLNATMFARFQDMDNRLSLICLSSLFEEGLTSSDVQTVYFERQPGKVYLLVYSNNSSVLNGKHVYGFDFLLSHLDELPPHYVIVFLDHTRSFSQCDIDDDRIIYLGFSVHFYSLLQLIDVYLRPTLTDGNSVMIQEALSVGIPVVASDVVDRYYSEVLCYRSGDFRHMLDKIAEALACDVSDRKIRLPSVDAYMNFLHSL